MDIAHSSAYITFYDYRVVRILALRSGSSHSCSQDRDGEGGSCKKIHWENTRDLEVGLAVRKYRGSASASASGLKFEKKFGSEHQNNGPKLRINSGPSHLVFLHASHHILNNCSPFVCSYSRSAMALDGASFAS